MATGLLGGVLPYIYSRADALKRTLGDVVSNPMASTEQVVNYANDRARYLNQLNAQVASQGLKGLMSPQGKELANLYTEAYNPVGMTAKDLSYRGSHLAPNAKTYGATLDDLTKILPEDVYSQQGKRLYGLGDRLVDSEWRIAALKARGKPNAEVEIFRAVPKGVKDINSGDWVSTSKAYAKQHGESALNGEYEIISKKVPAKTLSTEGYPYEYGYNINFEYPQQAALDIAQQRAALPVEYPLAPAGTRYEEFGGDLTYMTPDEFLQQVRPLQLDAESLDNIAALRRHVEAGGKLDPLHIYATGKEDGRHRAYLAKELGIEKVPVALHGQPITPIASPTYSDPFGNTIGSSIR